MGEYYRRASLAARRLAKNLYGRPVRKGFNPLAHLILVVVEEHLPAWEEGKHDPFIVELDSALNSPHLSYDLAIARVCGYLEGQQGREILREIIEQENISLPEKRSDLESEVLDLIGLTVESLPPFYLM